MSSKKDKKPVAGAGDPDVTYVELGMGRLDPSNSERIMISDEAMERAQEILDAPAEPTVALLKLMGAKVPTVH